MTQGTGHPVYLVQGNRAKIPLMAESITWTVDRTVGSIPVPFSGNTRIGMDLNMAQAAIVIEGVFADDTPVDDIASPNKASASINFAKTGSVGGTSLGNYHGDWWDGGPKPSYQVLNSGKSVTADASAAAMPWGPNYSSQNSKTWAGVRFGNGSQYWQLSLILEDSAGTLHRFYMCSGIDFSNTAFFGSGGASNWDEIGTASQEFPYMAGAPNATDKEIVIGVRGCNSLSALTTKLRDAINSTTLGNGPGNFFTATLSDYTPYMGSTFGNAGTNAILTIEHKTGGAFGGVTPSWGSIAGVDTAGQYPNQRIWSVPATALFSGGSASIQPRVYTTNVGGTNNLELSAGDKAYEMWVLLQNMNNSTMDTDDVVDVLQDLLGKFEDFVEDATDNLPIAGSFLNSIADFGFDVAEDAVQIFGNAIENMQLTDWNHPWASMQYIIGIQIPYQSMVSSPAGQKYIQRAFKVVTGHTQAESSFYKSAANTYDMNYDSAEIWRLFRHNTIKGTVKQFTMDYDAGESVYRWKMVFLPIDYIL